MLRGKAPWNGWALPEKVEIIIGMAASAIPILCYVILQMFSITEIVSDDQLAMLSSTMILLSCTVIVSTPRAWKKPSLLYVAQS